MVRNWKPEALWLCEACLYTAWEGAVEDPGYISAHRDPDDDICHGRMLRYSVERAPRYPDPQAGPNALGMPS